ncbi:hypothetical protein EDC56_2556 [Sinobacterium caligoides]|uniref:Virion coat protein B n=1 Tax=Sinobacterium caligoides TaxID=933926 RepID=A0A3N2DJT0_9GAMM|nr:hypothetical protein [Sinobacterium caligoides]ROR99921.1 hypothetical protein EDC56_2556 [Sinobacterium caligoides]
MLKEVKGKVVEFSKAGVVAGAGMLVSAGAMAADSDITDAFAAGEVSVGLAITGLIGLTAIMVGVGFIISLLKRS